MSGLITDEQQKIDQLQMKEVKTRLKDMQENSSGLLDGDQVLSEL